MAEQVPARIRRPGRGKSEVSHMTIVGEPIVREAGQLTEEDRSKDEFFVKLAHLAEAMIDAHGKDFAMGALVLTARFIAEGRPLTKPEAR
jgi:hypothetical protein